MGSMFVTDWKRESSKYRPFKTWVLADLEPSHFGLLRKIIKDFFFFLCNFKFLAASVFKVMPKRPLLQKVHTPFLFRWKRLCPRMNEPELEE